MATETSSERLDGEADQRAQLRRMKVLATLLLVIAAIIFIVARGYQDDHVWVGYVRATAEAAMVGAFADWFAVTALFRHPLGIPIPHTAIVKKRKNDIGEGLGDFVQSNFLTGEVVAEKLESVEISRRLGEWLQSLKTLDRWCRRSLLSSVRSPRS